MVGGCLAPGGQLAGLSPFGDPGCRSVPAAGPRIVRGCKEPWQLLFGRDLASCVS